MRNYYRCESVREAVGLLERFGEAAKVVAGGTEVLVDIHVGRIDPEHLVDVSFIEDLRKITVSEAWLVVGSAVTHRELATAPEVVSLAPSLAEAASQIGSPQVRNLGTIGGNLASAVPSADLAPPLLTLDAVLRLVGGSGERLVPLDGFATGPRTTVLHKDEIIAEVRIPKPDLRCGTCFLKFGRRKALSIAVVNAAVAIWLDEDMERISRARIAVGAVAPVPLRVRTAEDFLCGKVPSPDVVERAAELATAETRPINDMRASAEYRRTLTRVLIRRAILEALRRARSST